MQTHEFKKYFGQNFLTSKKPIIRMVDLLDVQDKTVIEIGPGDGRVTEEVLNKKPTQHIAIEIDHDLIPILENKFKNFPNFKLINQDFLQVNIQDFLEWKKYRVISSLPYNISKPIIKIFLESMNKPEALCLILQKEVAQDYTVQAPKSTFLSIYSSIFYEVAYKGTIKKELFIPRPQVDGGIIYMRLREHPYLPNNEEYRTFARFLKSAFLTPRKKLSSVLKSVYKEIDWVKEFKNQGIDSNVRAAELDTEVFLKLFEIFKQTKSNA